MKIVLVLILGLLVIATFSSRTGLAGSDDENYNGEDGEQPGIGVDEGSGYTSAPDGSDNRTRFKDR